MAKNNNLLQKALTEPYSLPYFSQNVLKPVFGGNLTVFASSIPIQVNPSEERMVKWIKKYGEVKLTDYRQVDLYEVALVDDVIVERSKVGIGAVVKKLIFGNNAVLANFYYPDQPNKSWRFSFIAKDQVVEKGETKKVETNPKRYTYILGPNERCRTAAERFNDLSLESDFTIKAFEKAFSVEKLSKKFFEEYKEHYDAFVKHHNKREIKASVFNGDEKAARDFAKKMLGRIVFLYFVQKKGWLGATNEKWQDGNPNFMEDLFIASGKKETFYPIWLRTLFYDSLNNPNRSHNDFKLPNGTTVKVPYLNGGLFEDDDPKDAAKYLTFPPRLFEDLFEFFNQYNFTIYEDSPDDHTVAVDPEMLGHIFENLLEDNKDKGAYYTPKEIVHYMCQESLIEYLATKLDISESVTYQELGVDQTTMFGNEAKKGQLSLTKEDKTEPMGITRHDVERFIKYKDTTPQIVKHASDINTHLDTVKICDPAIGSGAFPMGLLHEIFNAKQVLKESAEGGADVKELQSITDAEMKESIIQNSIYGVDIEKGAVDIARLRFWLSLIVDEELPRPLPNLDFKIVVGDSLLPKMRVNDAEEIVDIDWEAKYTTSTNEKLYNKLKGDLQQLVAVQKKYFSVRTDKEKAKLKHAIRDLKIEILINQLQLDKVKYSVKNTVNETMFGGGKKEKQKELEITIKLAGFQKMLKYLEQLQKHPNKSLQFFDWKLDFPEILNHAIAQREGFDIVIGNPPYITYHGRRRILVSNETMQIFRDSFESVLDKNIDGKYNAAMFFIEKFSKVCMQNGIFCCITDISFYEHFYSGLKKFLLENACIKNIVNGLSSFENVGSGQLILLAKNVKKGSKPFSNFVKINNSGLLSDPRFIEQGDWYKPEKHYQFSLPQKSLESIFDKFTKSSNSLESFFPNKLIRTGESVGVKEPGFVIDNKIKNPSVPIYEYLEGSKSVPERYCYPTPTRYFKYDLSLLNQRNESYRQEAKKNKRPNPKVLGLGDKLAFDNPKILIRQSCEYLCCTYTDQPYIFNRSFYSISNKNTSGNSNTDLLFVLGLLNSTLFTFYAQKNRIIRMEVGKQPQIRLEDIKSLPIIIPDIEVQKKIINLVKDILKKKKGNSLADTTYVENQIDVLVYHLYNLTYEEAKVIDPALSEEEFEKYRVEN